LAQVRCRRLCQVHFIVGKKFSLWRELFLMRQR
jgi:hypothetical protein